jgi:hypothetical protein
LPPISAALGAHIFIILTKTGTGSAMSTVTAEMTRKTTEKTTKNSTEDAALDRCYRQIGISAVLAAVRYQGTAKNPAYAPAEARRDERLEDAAA